MEPLADIFKKTDETAEMPPVSMTMADVSVRLAALEDAVAGLKKLLTPGAAAQKPLEYTNVFPAAMKKGGRRTRRHRKNRNSK